MEGTDETIERAARFANGRPLVVVKVSKPGQDMRFRCTRRGTPDRRNHEAHRSDGAGIDAARTLLFDRPKLIELADTVGIAIQAFSPEQVAEPKRGSGGMNKE